MKELVSIEDGLATVAETLSIFASLTVIAQVALEKKS
jgi:hypothetical protein